MKLPVSKGLYAITDCENISFENLLEKSEQILKAGVAIFQYRNKTKVMENKIKLAKSLQILCKKYSTPFIINDDLVLAKAINADGIHLGGKDQDLKFARVELGDIIIGISCYNNIDRAIDAEKNGADYVAFGSFFPSPTKPHAVKASYELLHEAKSCLSIPVVAIGGITPENGKLLLDTQVDFLAVISGLYSATDTEAVTKKYNKLFIN